MTDFIIDENIVMESHSLTDVHGKESFLSLAFITAFIQSTHRLALNDKIETKYRDFQDEIKNKGLYSSPIVSKIINRLIKGNIIKVQGIQDEFVGIKKCDKEFVGVSRQVRGTLVTNDQNLILKIKEHKLDKEFKTVMIKDAKSEL